MPPGSVHLSLSFLRNSKMFSSESNRATAAAGRIQFGFGLPGRRSNRVAPFQRFLFFDLFSKAGLNFRCIHRRLLTPNAYSAVARLVLEVGSSDRVKKNSPVGISYNCVNGRSRRSTQERVRIRFNTISESSVVFSRGVFECRAENFKAKG